LVGQGCGLEVGGLGLETEVEYSPFEGPLRAPLQKFT